MTKVNNSEEWVASLGLPLVERTKPPELILEDSNKKLEVWTQYRLLLFFLGGYFSSFMNILRQREICNPEKSQAWNVVGPRKGIGPMSTAQFHSRYLNVSHYSRKLLHLSVFHRLAR